MLNLDDNDAHLEHWSILRCDSYEEMKNIRYLQRHYEHKCWLGLIYLKNQRNIFHNHD